MEIIKIPIDELTPDPANAKDHPGWQIEQIKNSIERFGNLDPIGVWGDDNLIVEGHGRYEALKDLGYHEAECIRLDWLTEEERRAYALAHNKLTMNSGFIPEALDMTLDAIGEIDMSQFGFEIPEEEEPTEITEDEIPEEVETRCKLGDIWQLGEHRLICGDSTDLSVINKLMDGYKADIAITSPPYGESDSAKLRDHYVKGKDKRKSLYNQHDDKSNEWKDLMYSSYESMINASKAQFINVQMLAANKRTLVQFVCDNVESLVDIIVWDKKKAPPQMQKNILNNQYEFIFIFSNDNNSRTVPFGNFHGNINNVIELTCGQNEFADIHRAVYPVELPANIMKIADEAQTVLDVFGGTGTTLIACEHLNRKCYMCELDPHYCDVIIQRWENLTGGKAVLINDAG